MDIQVRRRRESRENDYLTNLKFKPFNANLHWGEKSFLGKCCEEIFVDLI